MESQRCCEYKSYPPDFIEPACLVQTSSKNHIFTIFTFVFSAKMKYNNEYYRLNPGSYHNCNLYSEQILIKPNNNSIWIDVEEQMYEYCDLYFSHVHQDVICLVLAERFPLHTRPAKRKNRAIIWYPKLKSRHGVTSLSENRFNLQRVSDSFTVHMTQNHYWRFAEPWWKISTTVLKNYT